MIDVEQTIASQYANSPTIVQLVKNMNDCIDPSADIDSFFKLVWNLESAEGIGLDIWGRIVGVSRELLIPGESSYFGFSEGLPGSYPFNEQPFYDENAISTQTYKLLDDAYKQLIFVKAMANISSTNAPSINRLLQNLFMGRGRCYVIDLGNMAFRYTFEFELTPYELAIITQSGAFPRPAGVDASIFQSPLPLFGFSEAGESASPFGQGIFIPQGATINAAN